MRGAKIRQRAEEGEEGGLYISDADGEGGVMGKVEVGSGKGKIV